MPDQGGPGTRFGVFELDVRNQELRKAGVLIKLAPQPMQLLAMLVARPGELVTRDEIQQELWGSDTFVDIDQSINHAVKQVRQALGDEAENPRFVATVPRRGYRFVAPVENVGAPVHVRLPATGEQTPASQTPARTPRLLHALGAVAVVSALLVVWLAWRPGSGSGLHRIRLLVLPFSNLTGDPSLDYIADGMTVEITAQLANVSPERIGVIARTTALTYQRSGKDVQQIGAELAVDYVVEGSVRLSASGLRTTIQLIRVADQMPVWSEHYDRSFGDTVVVQQEVARGVAIRLGGNLLPLDPLPAKPVNWAAHSSYTKGRNLLLDAETDENVGLALGYFQQAVAIDPRFAAAYAGIADAYTQMADREMPFRDAYKLARDHAEKALAIEPRLAEAQVTLANVLAWHDWKWQEADALFRRAIGTRPGYWEAQHSHSHFLSFLGRHDESIEISKQLLEFDPLSSHMNRHLGMAYIFAGRYDEAIEQMRRTVERHPNYTRSYTGLGQAYALKGMHGEAVRALRSAVERRGTSIEGLPELACALIADGHLSEGRQILEELRRLAETRFVSPRDLATIHVALGEREKALALLLPPLRARDASVEQLLRSPQLRSLATDPQFQQTLSALGLPLLQ